MFVIIPAAGIGKRYSSKLPKQYDIIGGSSVLELTVSRFLSHTQTHEVVVVISPDDNYFSELANQSEVLSDSRVSVCRGGNTRSQSVLNGIQFLFSKYANLNDDDLIAVHDSVRPFFSYKLLDNLINAANSNLHGAIAALPASDTIKQSESISSRQVIRQTLDRENIWLAQTPQIFPSKLLKACFEMLANSNQLENITDEAFAIELATNGQPTLVASSRYNIKITTPEDRWLAEMLIANPEIID